ncbi:MAG: hypothetical protein RLZZ387_4085 [Chloroflexota bacterium]|jgi:hypothetical protein
MPRARPWNIAAVSLVICAALVMSAVLGASAVQRGVLNPPRFTIGLGAARIDAFTTTAPSCRTPIGRSATTVMCSASQSIYSPSEYFAVWLLVRSQRGGVPREEGTRLFVLRLSERR